MSINKPKYILILYTLVLFFLLSNKSFSQINDSFYRQCRICNDLLNIDSNTQATICYKKILEGNPKYYKNWLRLSISYIKTNNLDSAEKAIIFSIKYGLLNSDYTSNKYLKDKNGNFIFDKNKIDSIYYYLHANINADNKCTSFKELLHSSIIMSNYIRNTSNDQKIYSLIDSLSYIVLRKYLIDTVFTNNTLCLCLDNNDLRLDIVALLIHLNYYNENQSIEIEKLSMNFMKNGIIEPKIYAYIIDRRLDLILKKKQKYGEHFIKLDDVYSDEEINQININRAELGLIKLNKN
jgi:hypothetical protein